MLIYYEVVDCSKHCEVQSLSGSSDARANINITLQYLIIYDFYISHAYDTTAGIRINDVSGL